MARRPVTPRDGQAAGRRRVALLVLPGRATIDGPTRELRGRSPSTDVAHIGAGDRPEASGERRNLTIEGLRGFSAAAVISYHVHNMAINGDYFHPHHGPIVNSLVRSLGRFGVLMFFMISGYLIVQSLVRYGSIPRFLNHRFWRIYPVFAPLHLIMFTLGPWQGYEWMGALKHSLPQYTLQFFSNLLLLPGIFRLPIAQRNAWSLSYEFAFYLPCTRPCHDPGNERAGRWMGTAKTECGLHTFWKKLGSQERPTASPRPEGAPGRRSTS